MALAALLPGRAAATPTEDAFIAGYATAVLERDFRVTSTALRVHDGILSVADGDFAGVDRRQVVGALSKIRGVRRVELVPAATATPAPPGAFRTSQPSQPLLPAAGGAPASSASQRGEAPQGDVQQAEADHQGLVILPARRLFDPLRADPREPHFAASFIHINNSPQLESGGAVSFGTVLPLAETDAPFGGRIQLGLLGSVFALFDTASESDDLIDADYFIGVPINWRNGPWSAQLRYFHQSSHLGDEFLLRNSGVQRVNLSYEQADLRVSYDISDQFRTYLGYGRILRSEPTFEHNLFQGGAEYTSNLSFFWNLLRPVAGMDLQAREFQHWQPDLSLRAGLQLDRPLPADRKIQFLLEYYNGKSPWGQFLFQNVEWYGIGTHFYF